MSGSYQKTITEVSKRPVLTRTDRVNVFSTINNYIEVLKPRETALLTFIGVCSAFVAAGGYPSLNRLLMIFVAVLVASAGANGLTNYLDRDIDAKMERTRRRALPSKKISPSEKVLPLTIGLTVIGLVLAWLLHPLVFLFDMVGTVAAVVWRKRVTCVFPQGMLASCAPVLMGWLAIKPVFSWEIVILCVLISVWLPSHIWSVMIARREDYLNAGIGYFPISWEVKDAVKLLPVSAVLLYASSMVFYFVGGFGWLYLTAANFLGIIVVYASLRLVFSSKSNEVWRLYKLSAFPYLGMLFLFICLDILLLG